MNKFDMHIHSYYSDGEYDIEKIIDLLKNHHIQYFSISDHDNIDSVFHIKDYDLKGLTYIFRLSFRMTILFEVFHDLLTDVRQ